MSFAPHRDWDFYRSIASRHDVSIERTPEDRFHIYVNFFDTIADAQRILRQSSAVDRERRDEKLTIRRKIVSVLQALDKWNRENDAADGSA